MPAGKDAIKDVIVDVNMNFAQIFVLATKKEIMRTNNEVTTEVTIIVLCIYLHIIIVFNTTLRGYRDIFDFNVKRVISINFPTKWYII